MFVFIWVGGSGLPHNQVELSCLGFSTHFIPCSLFCSLKLVDIHHLHPLGEKTPQQNHFSSRQFFMCVLLKVCFPVGLSSIYLLRRHWPKTTFLATGVRESQDVKMGTALLRATRRCWGLVKAAELPRKPCWNRGCADFVVVFHMNRSFLVSPWCLKTTVCSVAEVPKSAVLSGKMAWGSLGKDMKS